MIATGAHLATAFLAAPPTPPPGKGAEWGKATPIGLLVLVLLGVALYLLIKSMNKHMRKVSGLTSFETTDGPTADPGSVGGGSADASPGGLGGDDLAAQAERTTAVSDADQQSRNDAPRSSTDPKS
ncbi:MAG: hypothetical protein WKF57_13580 [Nakamurella sp.]